MAERTIYGTKTIQAIASVIGADCKGASSLKVANDDKLTTLVFTMVDNSQLSFDINITKRESK